MKLQSALQLIYPSECLACRTLVEGEQALCGPCWRETPFIHGLACCSCGTPLPGEDSGCEVRCDDCLKIARPWARGRAALLYRGTARGITLRLKHGDRTHYARPAAAWMAAVAPEMDADTAVVPVPLHWLRLLKRRYNQSALLAKHVARTLGLEYLPDALKRPNVTESLDGRTRDARFSILEGAIKAHPRKGAALKGRAVLLIDDVMTSGATLAACTEACVSAGARSVDVLVLARVSKDD